MKFTTRLFLSWVSIFLTFYLAVMFLVAVFWGLDIAFWQAALVFFVAGVIPPAAITAFFYRRLDYMESENLEPPHFSGQKKAVLQFKARSEHHFDEIMQRVDRQWIISFSDRESNVLKFRTDTRIMAWGLGGYLKMEDESTVLVVIYPMYPNSKREERFMNQTLRIMQNILNP